MPGNRARIDSTWTPHECAAPVRRRDRMARTRREKGDGLFERIVVGTDGSETATEAVRQAIELAKLSGTKLDIVPAFEPIPQSRLREEQGEVPGDVAYAVSPREDVNVTLEGAVGMARQEAVET